MLLAATWLNIAQAGARPPQTPSHCHVTDGLFICQAFVEVGGYNRFSRVAGTSAGAVVGCVVAAGSAKGKTAADIVKLLQQDLDEADFSSFVDGQGFLNPFALGHLLALNKGEVIKDWLRKQLQTALDSDKEPTFGALNTGNRGVQPAANSPAFLVFPPTAVTVLNFYVLALAHAEIRSADAPERVMSSMLQPLVACAQQDRKHVGTVT